MCFCVKKVLLFVRDWDGGGLRLRFWVTVQKGWETLRQLFVQHRICSLLTLLTGVHGERAEGFKFLRVSRREWHGPAALVMELISACYYKCFLVFVSKSRFLSLAI